MDKFISFIKKIYVFLLFIVLEAIAINFYAKSTPYNRAKLLTVSHTIAGSINQHLLGIHSYFGLRKQNEILIDQLVTLHNTLQSYEQQIGKQKVEPNQELTPYHYYHSHVVGNSVNKQQNYITLNSGQREGLGANMAITTLDGKMVGYVLSSSDKFSVGCSVLNTSFQTSAKIKGQDYFGSVYWNGTDHNYLNIKELPKYANPILGDTIISTDYSSIFPEGIMIGTIESFELASHNYYELKVKIAANISSLKDVLVINYHEYAERQLLEKNTKVEK